MEVLHNHFDQQQDEHIRCGQPNKSIANQADKVEKAGRELIDAFRQFFQFAFGVCAEVDERHQEATGFVPGKMKCTTFCISKKKTIVSKDKAEKVQKPRLLN